MKRLLTLLVVICLVSFSAQAQDKTAVKYASTITPEDMKAKLSILASDDFQGRETGTPGQEKASKFLEDFYLKIGLQGPVDGTYRQKFTMYQSDWSEVYLKTKSGKKINGKDIIFFGNANMSKELKLSTVFVGNGETLDKMDIKGKGVITMSSSRELLEKINTSGAKAVFIVSADDEQFKQTLPRQARRALLSRLRFDKVNAGGESMIFYITKAIAAEMLNTSADKMELAIANPSSLKARSVSLKVTEKLKELNTENMVAFLEGTDLKDEILVISSHFDHIGQNEDGTVINNGADDDGSGTTGVMEIAEAFAQAAKEGIKPRRSILFLNVTGEEKGLLGSEYYSDNPLFPLENTVNNLNIDMIGRVDPDHENDRDYVYVIGSEKLSSHLKVISEYANITYSGLNLDYRYDDPADTNRFY
jgi:hypothetical protein